MTPKCDGCGRFVKIPKRAQSLFTIVLEPVYEPVYEDFELLCARCEDRCKTEDMVLVPSEDV